MPWLPGIPICEQPLQLPLSSSDADCLIGALIENNLDRRRVRWLRLLLQSPTTLIWSVNQVPSASNISHLISALECGQVTPTEVAARTVRKPAFHGSADWCSAVQESIRRLWRILSTLETAGPHPFVSSSLVRSNSSHSAVVATKPKLSAPPNSSDVKSELLGQFEHIVRPFWPVPEPPPRKWLLEQFDHFEFLLCPADRQTLQSEVEDVEIGQSVDAWHRPATGESDDLLPHVADRLFFANRLAEEFSNEKLAALKQLAYGASHEINNPLANIATRAQLLLASEKDEGRRKHLSTIFHQAMRAHEMISDMMLFAHPPAPRFESVSLGKVIRQAVNECRPFVQQAGWSIEDECESDENTVSADSNQLISLLQALVQNAIESRSTGHVSIACFGPRDGRARIEVRDNGPGISPETARHMFDPFYSGREAGRGLGFGLSKAWTIARLHGGNIHVQSTGPTGTILAIDLPRLGSCKS